MFYFVFVRAIVARHVALWLEKMPPQILNMVRVIKTNAYYTVYLIIAFF